MRPPTTVPNLIAVLDAARLYTIVGSAAVRCAISVGLLYLDRLITRRSIIIPPSMKKGGSPPAGIYLPLKIQVNHTPIYLWQSSLLVIVQGRYVDIYNKRHLTQST